MIELSTDTLYIFFFFYLFILQKTSMTIGKFKQIQSEAFLYFQISYTPDYFCTPWVIIKKIKIKHSEMANKLLAIIMFSKSGLYCSYVKATLVFGVAQPSHKKNNKKNKTN